MFNTISVVVEAQDGKLCYRLWPATPWVKEGKIIIVRFYNNLFLIETSREKWIMEPSDWIAIVALAASAIISIAGFLFNYRTNRENIRARRADLVAEKSIEAYREVVERLRKVEVAVRVEGNLDDAIELWKSLVDASHKYSFYFPTTISNDFSDILYNELEEILHEERVSDGVHDELEDADWQIVRSKLDVLLFRMQKYMGMEREETF